MLRGRIFCFHSAVFMIYPPYRRIFRPKLDYAVIEIPIQRVYNNIRTDVGSINIGGTAL